MVSTLERARHRWREILPLVGIETKFLTNKHGPCPLCGGKDRFRFDDKDGTGSYYCSQVGCGPGTGFVLLRKFTGWDNKKAFEEIDKIVGNVQPVPEQQKPERDLKGHRDKLTQILLDADAQHVVDEYLDSRGISERSPILHGIERCPFYDSDGNFMGVFPAVLVGITGPDNMLQSVQRIYIGDVFPRKKVMKPVTTIKGAAIRLYQREPVLGIAEGVETALSAAELYGIPTWSVVSAGGMESFQPPPIVKHLHIFGDNDRSFTGQASAYTLAKRLRQEKPDLKIEVHLPKKEDTDFNDLLRELKHAQR